MFVDPEVHRLSNSACHGRIGALSDSKHAVLWALACGVTHEQAQMRCVLPSKPKRLLCIISSSVRVVRVVRIRHNDNEAMARGEISQQLLQPRELHIPSMLRQARVLRKKRAEDRVDDEQPEPAHPLAYIHGTELGTQVFEGITELRQPCRIAHAHTLFEQLSALL